MNRAYLDYCRRRGNFIQEEHEAARQRNLAANILTQEELLQVYETAASPDVKTLQKAAVRMFPERFGLRPPDIYRHDGGSCAFRHHGEYVRPKYTLSTPPLNQIGVMDDGTAYLY